MLIRTGLYPLRQWKKWNCEWTINLKWNPINFYACCLICTVGAYCVILICTSLHQQNIFLFPCGHRVSMNIFRSVSQDRRNRAIWWGHSVCGTRVSIVAGQVKFSGSVLHFNPSSPGWSITHIKTRELSTYSECSHDERSCRYDQPTYFFLRFFNIVPGRVSH